MADIFLSYADEDRQAARRIVGVLESQGWSVWWDRRIPTGKTWRSAIEDSIRDMRCMVVLWSSNSIGSQWVHDEAEEGRAAGKLMPVLIEQVRPPLGLRGIQATDLIDWDGSDDDAAVRQLISDIAAMLEASAPPKTGPAPIAQRPLAPQAAKRARLQPVWAGALVLAMVATLVLVLRQRPTEPGDTRPMTSQTPPAAAIAVPAPAPVAPASVNAPVAAPAAVAPASPQESSPVKTTPSESAPPKPVVAQKPEPPLAPVAKRGGKSKVDPSRCEAILQRAQLGTPLGDEDKAFLKRDCQP